MHGSLVMRRVYEQGHRITSAKFMLLVASYFPGLMLILVFTTLFEARST